MKTIISSIYYTLLLVVAGFSGAFAQEGQSGTKITGKLVNEQNVPVDYATVSLLKTTDSTVVKGTLTSEAGIYTFENVKPGNYIVKASNIGYAKTITAPFTIEKGKDLFTPGDIKMSTTSKTLSTVNVISTKPLIERKIDRTVMNVENSILAAGNNAMEILERAPGVTIDKDDNISLKGKQGVTVMINDKLTYLSAQELATFLRSTDGNTISSIEIITNPSAKYDAAGNSGIINIKLKKNKQSGTNGNFTAAVARASSIRNSQNLNINHKEGNLNVFGSLSRGDIPHNRLIDINRKTVVNGVDNYFIQKSRSPQTYHYNNFKIGADLDVSKKNTVGFVVSGNSDKNQGQNYNHTDIGSTRTTVDSSLNTNSLMDGKFSNIAVNLNERWQIDTLGQTLSADLDYSRFNNNNNANYITYYSLPDGSVQHAPQLLQNETPSVITIRSAKIDYAKPLSKTVKFEAGAKFSDVKTDNDLRAQKFDGTAYVNDTTRSNRFIYTEKISAGYLNLNKQYKTGSVQVGLRAEYTQSNGNLIGSAPVDRSYLNFFPSVFLNQTLDKKNELTFSYSRRIDRPNYSQLNPFVYYLDPYTFSKGNAFLKPQYTNNFELGYVYNKTIDVSLGYSHTTDANTEIILTQGNKSFQTTLNLATQTSYNINIFAPYTIAKWWTGNANFNGFNNTYKANNINGGNIDNGSAGFVFKTTQNLVFGTFKAEVQYNYNSRMTMGIYNMHARQTTSAAVSKTFADKKFNLKFGVDDIFNTSRFDVDSYQLGNDFTIRQKNDSRVFRLTATYNFGNSKIKQREHRTGAEEESNRAGH